VKILILDIETAPLLGHVWYPWGDNVNPNQLVHDSFMLTWAAKWYGESEILTDQITPAEAKKQDDKRIAKSLGKLIEEADALVAHNLDKFDLPKINTRILFHGLEPLPPVTQIDTLKLAKKAFKVTYNRLDYLGEFLGVGEKLSVDFQLWRDAYMGSQDAIDEMRAYNAQDVVLLERVFLRLLPYVRSMQRLVDPVEEEDHACPTCGGRRLVRRGYYRTKVSNFVRYQCKECKRYSRARRSERAKLSVTPL